MTKAIAVQCKAFSKQTGQRCKRKAIPGGEVCRWHGEAAGQVKVKAAIRAEVLNWGLGDSTVDPGEVLLRLVTQSAARAEMYARLLEEAYEAAERLKQAHDAGEFKIEDSDTAATARRDLDRIQHGRRGSSGRQHLRSGQGRWCVRHRRSDPGPC